LNLDLENETELNLDLENETELNLDLENDTELNLDLENDTEIEDENYGETILNFGNSETKRLNALELCSDNEKIEYITRLIGMYQFSPINVLQSFLIQVVKKSKIDGLLKLECAKALESKGLECLSHIIENEDLPSPCRIEAIHLLLIDEYYSKFGIKHLINFINDYNINCDFRYKNIIELEKQGLNLMTEHLCWLLDNIDLGTELLKKFEKALKSSFPEWKPTPDNEDLVYLMIEMLDYTSAKYFFKKYVENIYFGYDIFIKTSQQEFIEKPENSIYYRILSGQYLLQKCELNGDETMGVFSVLTQFANDVTVEYNRRADAADVLLQLGDENTKKIGRQLIIDLGINHNSVTIFDNAQNVHTQEVEDSVLETLEFFASIPLMTVNKLPINFEYVNKQIETILTNRGEKDYEESNKNIRLALNRIRLDRALYSKYNNTLSNILIRLWSYMKKHKFEEEMIKRLLEELEEMSGTCSTGFITRLINVPSGFGDFSVRISWEDQIIANLAGRLNAQMRKIDKENWGKYESEIKKTIGELEEDEDIYEEFKANVMMELAMISSKTAKRKNFNLFFLKTIANIREEMYKEFTDYLDDASFDLYMRKALSRYEGN
jgi:hypothetical protein